MGDKIKLRHGRKARDGARRTPTYRLSSTASPAPAARLNAVFLGIRKIRVARPREAVHRIPPVVLGPMVLVLHQHGDGRAQRHAELGPRLDLHPVFLVARRRDRALAGSSAGELRLDVVGGQGEAGGTAVDDAADAETVGFPIAFAKDQNWTRGKFNSNFTYVVTRK